MAKRIFEDITATVGATPLVKINKLGSGEATILAKLESFNPCGSVKDRIAVSMIAAGEEAGKIRLGGEIIEPTSGNTGIGLAFVCAAKGYKLTLTMPESMSTERRKLLEILGARLVLTPAELGMTGAVDKARDLLKRTPGAFMPQQFENPANPDVHRRTTAKEIWGDTNGEVDILVVGIGTGGTVTGCGQVLKQKNPQIKVVAIEPAGSAILSGGKPGPHKIQGIGAGFVPAVLDMDVVDDICKVANEEALEGARQLALQEGILAGISSGAAIHAAVEISKSPDSKGKTIVVILPDTGERYISTEMYDSN